MVYVAMSPDGRNIAFQTKAEMDAYIERANKRQTAYDQNPASHTAVDEALDKWAQKAARLNERWSDPQVRQDLIQELASIKRGNDKGFMISDPTSRFNVAYDEFMRRQYQSKDNSSVNYYKNGKKVAEPKKGEEYAKGSFENLFIDHLEMPPMTKITLMRVDGLTRFGAAGVALAITHLQEYPEMLREYQQAVNQSVLNMDFSSEKGLEMLSAIERDNVQGFMRQGLEEYFGEHGINYLMTKALASNLSSVEKVRALKLIAYYAQKLDILDESRAQRRTQANARIMQSDKRMKRGIFALKPQKEDDTDFLKGKLEVLESLSMKGYPSAQEQLSEYYIEQKDFQKANIQLRRLENSEFISEDMRKAVVQKRNEIRPLLKSQLDLRAKVAARAQSAQRRAEKVANPKRRSLRDMLLVLRKTTSPATPEKAVARIGARKALHKAMLDSPTHE